MKYKVVKSIKDKGFPTSSKRYKSAHEYANKIEKKNDPKEYEAMKKVDRKIGKKELVGKSTKSGKILISKKVPKKYRKEVAKYHELPENKKLLKKPYKDKK